MSARLLAFVWLGSALASAGVVGSSQPIQHLGMCDASAGVFVSTNLCLVANDEDNALRLYRTDQSGGPVKSYDFESFLDVRGKSRECDLEGAARMGDRAFWIGSHGRNKNGKERRNRCRFFATDLTYTNNELTLRPVGKPCERLLDDLLADARFDRFHLAQASRLAPKETGALNIEGLSATPEGRLLIGFRNPIPDGKALLIPLLNPNEVIAGSRARFDPAILLDLGGLGIRDMVWHSGTYFLIGGPDHGRGPCQLYRWNGPGTSPELLKQDIGEGCHPEALIPFPQPAPMRLLVLSDDGTRLVGGCPCKELTDPSQRCFRSFWVTP